MSSACGGSQDTPSAPSSARDDNILSHAPSTSSSFANGVPLAALIDKRSPEPDKQQQQTEETDAAYHTAAIVRSFLIGKLIMLPKLKLKASGVFQPEDHASKTFAGHSRFRVTALNYGGIYGSGYALFVGYAWALRQLEKEQPFRKGVDEGIIDEDTARWSRSALAGAFGGLLYSVCATPIVSVVRSGGPDSFSSAGPWLRRLFARPLLYTVPRDAGGFALYFGTYTACTRAIQGLSPPTPTPPATPPTTLTTPTNWLTTLKQIIPQLATALAAGSAAGVATYMWRSPFDTLYKQRMGWRALDAPLLSPQRFVTSPRGLRAVFTSGMTWAAYEFAVFGVRELTERGYLVE